ncbi:uncharacterized protein J3D65DRAFT_630901 [Phyllosticta citribraziliensis]|uniref:Uncharacterized protein n=1 Tax=Phyllosticta citribraziliensis TaxID=989973 RepID=A0ABR1LJI6_9PEZI
MPCPDLVWHLASARCADAATSAHCRPGANQTGPETKLPRARCRWWLDDSEKEECVRCVRMIVRGDCCCKQAAPRKSVSGRLETIWGGHPREGRPGQRSAEAKKKGCSGSSCSIGDASGSRRPRKCDTRHQDRRRSLSASLFARGLLVRKTLDRRLSMSTTQAVMPEAGRVRIREILAPSASSSSSSMRPVAR